MVALVVKTVFCDVIIFFFLPIVTPLTHNEQVLPVSVFTEVCHDCRKFAFEFLTLALENVMIDFALIVHRF